MTCEIGRLLLFDPDLGNVEDSREAAVVGVPIKGADRFGVVVLRSPPMKLTSEITRSSSSTANGVILGSGFTSSSTPWALHSPLGSMSTCSTERDVFASMSLTYLAFKISDYSQQCELETHSSTAS